MKSRFITKSHHRTVFALAFALSVLPGSTSHAETDTSNSTLTEAARENRSQLNFDGNIFAGPALDQLLAAARDAQFFMIGEEHGIAENPKLVAQLFTTLVADDYEKLAIEISPPMAAIVDGVAKTNGIDGLRDLYASPATGRCCSGCGI